MNVLDKGAFEDAHALAGRYWAGFQRAPESGRIEAGGSPKVILAAEALALILPRSLENLLGEAGAEIAMHDFGTAYGAAEAENFVVWAKEQGGSSEIARYAVLYWPMFSGLTPQITVLEAHQEPHPLILVEVAGGTLNELRTSKGLDARPARMFVGGMLAGALGKVLGCYLGARELEGGSEGCRIVIAPPEILASDLEAPGLSAPAGDFADRVVLRA
jgi:hypothetical protein